MKKIILIASIAWLAAVGTPVLAPIAGVGVAQARQLPDSQISRKKPARQW